MVFDLWTSVTGITDPEKPQSQDQKSKDGGPKTKGQPPKTKGQPPKTQRPTTNDTSRFLLASYTFTTIWKVRAPQEEVWDLIFNSERWPTWWRGVEKVERLKDGDVNNVGAVLRYTWKSKLPYRLVFDMETTRVVPQSTIEGRAVGELQGHGQWTLSHDDGITTVHYDWNVETTKAWMNLLSPVARPFFSWNHDVVMGWGGEGLASQLGTSLVYDKL